MMLTQDSVRLAGVCHSPYHLIALLTASAGWRSSEAKETSTPMSSAAARHRGRNQPTRGSLMTTLSRPTNCTASQARSSFTVSACSAAVAVSSQAAGRESHIETRRARRRRRWKSTTHRDSPNPRGLVESAWTSGCGTWNPARLRIVVNKLVPLRPTPATITSRL
jgi:hypothetical protein